MQGDQRRTPDGSAPGSEPETGAAAALARLKRAIDRTRLALLAERVLDAFWPVWSLVFLAVALVRLQILGVFPELMRFGILAVLLAAMGWSLWRGIRRFRMPERADAVRRIDDDLPGRPVSALGDRQATGRGDAAASAIWALHMTRIARLAESARAARPDLRLQKADPRALRLGAFALFLAALLFGTGSLREQLDPTVITPAGPVAESGPVLEAWASPPAYTGRPVLYLSEISGSDTLTVPRGTTVTLRLYGGSDTPGLTETISAGGDVALSGEEGLSAAEFTIWGDGLLRVEDGGETLGDWAFEIIPDTPPSIEMTGTPERTREGAGVFTYSAADDYGITAAWARVELDLDRVDRRYGLAAAPEPREAIEFDLPLPRSGGAEEYEERAVVDLARHPWAGLPVRITLHARDAAGQDAVSEPYGVILPGRRFYEPLARAIIEQRRDLLWTVANAARADRVLKSVTHRPQEIFDGTSAYLATRTAIRRLDYALDEGREAAVRDDVAEMLWRAALQVEEGDLGSALERLRRAQERLSQALDDPMAGDREIAELMQEMRDAMQDYLQEMMRQALENQQEGQQDDQAQAQPDMSTQDLQDMLDQLQEMMENGQRAEAQELLEQLQRLMENMQMTLQQGQSGQQGEGDQTMQGLQDLMREQQGLGDRTFEELQRQFGQQGQPGQPGQPGQQGQGQGQQGGETGELGRQQEALRQLLEDLRQGLPQGLPGADGDDPSGDARRALEEAERNMGEARDSLENGDAGEAVDRQAEALENLREGMRSLDEATRQAQQQGQDGEQSGENGQAGATDPLGRATGGQGDIDGNDVEVPGTEAWKRSRELQDEIRRRSSEQDRPEPERDYLERLLDRF